jgi:hypothetical protein
MANPCESHAFTETYGPFLVRFDVETPLGYEDRMLSFEPDGIVKISELQHTLTQAVDQHPADIAVSISGAEPVDVRCGASSTVIRSEAEPSAPATTSWEVPVWLCTRYALSNVWLDFPYVVRLWAANLTEVALPDRTLPAKLTVAGVRYLIDGVYAGILPFDHEPAAPTPTGF